DLRPRCLEAFEAVAQRIIVVYPARNSATGGNHGIQFQAVARAAAGIRTGHASPGSPLHARDAKQELTELVQGERRRTIASLRATRFEHAGERYVSRFEPFEIGTRQRGHTGRHDRLDGGRGTSGRTGPFQGLEIAALPAGARVEHETAKIPLPRGPGRVRET